VYAHGKERLSERDTNSKSLMNLYPTYYLVLCMRSPELKKPLTEEGPKLEARRRIVLWITILQGHN
jgi:hypothetical protein